MMEALLFDVCGTVVDWRGSLIRQIEEFSALTGIDIPAAEVTDEWRSRHGPLMAMVQAREIPWRNLDGLHADSLEEILETRGIEVAEDHISHLTRTWHRLDPWPDAIPGLLRLKKHSTLATMSNGGVAMLTNMARYAGLPWDVILSAELARSYMPGLDSFRYNVSLLGLAPSQTMLVSSNPKDLQTVTTIGMHTAFVQRPYEWGDNNPSRLDPLGPVDIVCAGIEDLADRLRA